jgi:hypothetical protein
MAKNCGEAATKISITKMEKRLTGRATVSTFISCADEVMKSENSDELIIIEHFNMSRKCNAVAATVGRILKN